jgi:hypothetical protein
MTRLVSIAIAAVSSNIAVAVDIAIFLSHVYVNCIMLAGEAFDKASRILNLSTGTKLN